MIKLLPGQKVELGDDSPLIRAPFASYSRAIREPLALKEKKMIKVLTLGLIHQPPKILLGFKKRGFGRDRWNGFGGKLKAGESLEDGLKREIAEEAGIIVDNAVKMGIIEFEFLDNPEILQVHIYKATLFTGEIAESEEMKPQWFNEAEIPYGQMWPDDIYWLPLFLRNKKFKGKFLFGENDAILKKYLAEVGELN